MSDYVLLGQSMKNDTRTRSFNCALTDDFKPGSFVKVKEATTANTAVLVEAITADNGDDAFGVVSNCNSRKGSVSVVYRGHVTCLPGSTNFGTVKVGDCLKTKTTSKCTKINVISKQQYMENLTVTDCYEVYLG